MKTRVLKLLAMIFMLIWASMFLFSLAKGDVFALTVLTLLIAFFIIFLIDSIHLRRGIVKVTNFVFALFVGVMTAWLFMDLVDVPAFSRNTVMKIVFVILHWPVAIDSFSRTRR